MIIQDWKVYLPIPVPYMLNWCKFLCLSDTDPLYHVPYQFNPRILWIGRFVVKQNIETEVKKNKTHFSLNVYVTRKLVITIIKISLHIPAKSCKIWRKRKRMEKFYNLCWQVSLTFLYFSWQQVTMQGLPRTWREGWEFISFCSPFIFIGW